MQRINYEIEDREAVMAQIFADGKQIVNDVTINLDENGRLTTCYCDIEEAPSAPPDETADLQAYFDGMTEVLESE